MLTNEYTIKNSIKKHIRVILIHSILNYFFKNFLFKMHISYRYNFVARN